VKTVTSRVPHVEQELLSFPQHLSYPRVCSGVRVAGFLVFCVVFCRLLFVLFLLAIVFSVLLQFTGSDYPFGIIKLFSQQTVKKAIYALMHFIIFSRNMYTFVIFSKQIVNSLYNVSSYIFSGGFRGGVRGERPPKIRKAYVIQR
jgi:hypothetical protein